MRTWLLALMTVLVAFSGCFGGDDGGDDTTTTPTATSTGTSTQTTTSTSTQTGDPEPDDNTPPTASISASIEQGEIPFDVNFTLEGADADGDDLTWTFDADEDGAVDAEGSELPFEYTHTYTAEGTFNATLAVSDGTNETVLVLVIDAAAAAAGEGPAQSFEGSWTVGGFGCGFRATDATRDVQQGAGVSWVEVDPATIGKPFRAEVTPAEQGDLEIVYEFYDGAEFSGDSVTEAPYVFTGTVPPGAEWIQFRSCAATGKSVSYTAG